MKLRRNQKEIRGIKTGKNTRRKNPETGVPKHSSTQAASSADSCPLSASSRQRGSYQGTPSGVPKGP
jgi:hypothetical protein